MDLLFCQIFRKLRDGCGFLALILRSELANKIRNSKELNVLGVPRILQEMNTMREVTVEHRYRHAITEPTRIQQMILDVMGIQTE